jgi:hypothetical protein
LVSSVTIGFAVPLFADCVLFYIYLCPSDRNFSSLVMLVRMNVTGFLGRLRDQRIIFVGGLLGRDLCESLVCILHHGVKNKKSMYARSQRTSSKQEDSTPSSSGMGSLNQF